MTMPEPTSCDKCGASLEHGYSVSYNSRGKQTGVVCFGCAKKESYAEHARTGVITTRLMTTAVLDAYRGPSNEVAEQVDRIQAAVRRFEQTVWFGESGIAAHLATHDDRGESLTHNGLKLLTYVMAGRVMVTLEDKHASVTLITTDETSDRPRMGIQGIEATEGQAIDLIDRAGIAWRNGVRTKPDRKVNLGF